MSAKGKPRGAGKAMSPAEEAQANPLKFFSAVETAKILGLSRNTLTFLRAAGAPTLAGKFNPLLLVNWIEQHPEETSGKIREEDED